MIVSTIVRLLVLGLCFDLLSGCSGLNVHRYVNSASQADVAVLVAGPEGESVFESHPFIWSVDGDALRRTGERTQIVEIAKGPHSVEVGLEGSLALDEAFREPHVNRYRAGFEAQSGHTYRVRVTVKSVGWYRHEWNAEIVDVGPIVSR